MSLRTMGTTAAKSHPSRGAWIEILLLSFRGGGIGRTPHGVRGLKYRKIVYSVQRRNSRTPHGVRGLK